MVIEEQAGDGVEEKQEVSRVVEKEDRDSLVEEQAGLKVERAEVGDHCS